MYQHNRSITTQSQYEAEALRVSRDVMLTKARLNHTLLHGFGLERQRSAVGRYAYEARRFNRLLVAKLREG